MANIRTQAVFPYTSGNPSDIWTNVMHWTTDLIGDYLPVVADEIADRLSAFYDTIYSLSASPANYVQWSNAYVLVFDQDDPPPRVPEVRDLDISIGPGTTTIPSDVAVVMSYHSAPASGVPRQRLHNRIYLGGLGTTAIAGVSNETPIVASAFRDSIAGAATTLLAANDGNCSWVQRSMTPVLTNREIVGGWIDNEPDTQRSRGRAPGTKTFWS